MANLYKIWQEKNNGYDTYDSAVVCASSEEEARRIHPSGNPGASWQQDWCQPKDVDVKLIGITTENISIGSVIVCSFNAG